MSATVDKDIAHHNDDNPLYPLRNPETVQRLRDAITNIIGYAPFLLLYDGANLDNIDYGTAYLTTVTPNHQSVIVNEGLIFEAVAQYTN
jgi:hypothetical protein